MEDLVHSYWWVIFPVLGMIMGFYAMIAQFRHKNEMLKLVKSYVDQGKEPPANLIDKLDGDSDDYGEKGGSGGWTSVVVFGALAAAFGYFGYTEGHKVFIALSIGFGIAAVGTLIITIIGSLRSRR